METVERREGLRLARREVLALGVGAFVIGLVPVAARRRATLVRRTLPVMGTIAEVAVVHAEPRAGHAAIDAALEALLDVDRRMTRFAPASEIGRVNRLAARDAVSVSGATAAVVTEALAWAEASDGAFDPCLGRATGLWDVEHRTVPPAAAAVGRLAGRRFYRALDVGTWRGQLAVRLTDPEAQLDLGGIAKGYGVDRAIDALRRRGIRQALVTVGGDLHALGGAPGGDAWRVGIRSPEDPARLAGELTVRDAAVATSGDYFRYFQHGGRRYHHILDPATGAPRRTPVRSVTVTAACCATADVAATAVYGMPPAMAERVLGRRAPDVRLVRVIGDGPADAETGRPEEVFHG